MRLIDADALIEFCEERWIPLNIDAVNMQPTIQPEKEQLSCEGTTSDLISRQTAIDRFNVIRPVDPKKDEYTKGIDVGIAMCIVAVKDQPTVQPEPHEGHWIEGGIYRDVIECNCSECGQLMTTAATVRMNFCPNCGAKMKGVTK